MFINLLSNAAQSIPRGAADLNEIRVRAGASGVHAVVEVFDTGSGMAPGVKAHLFEPFFTTKSAGGGTGLGLFISRDIVAEHGGRLEVESAPGRGSVFRVVLPLQAAGGGSPHSGRTPMDKMAACGV